MVNIPCKIYLGDTPPLIPLAIYDFVTPYPERKANRAAPKTPAEPNIFKLVSPAKYLK